jgi:hypothetical protein
MSDKRRRQGSVCRQASVGVHTCAGSPIRASPELAGGCYDVDATQFQSALKIDSRLRSHPPSPGHSTPTRVPLHRSRDSALAGFHGVQVTEGAVSGSPWRGGDRAQEQRSSEC